MHSISELYAVLKEYTLHLKNEEYADNSIKCYNKDIEALLLYLEKNHFEFRKENLLAYKKSLENTMSPTSTNRHIASINGLLKFMERQDLSIKPLKIQEISYADNELTERDFKKLLNAALSMGKHKIALIMLTLAGTGIRISELRAITAASLLQGWTEIKSKGTIRTVIIPRELQIILRDFCKGNKIPEGPIFVNRQGKPLSRSYISLQMKIIAESCKVSPDKVYPHNFRHYFARRFLDSKNPITDLADHLGHKSIDTTRRYLKTTTAAKQRQLSRISVFTSPINGSESLSDYLFSQKDNLPSQKDKNPKVE